VFGPLYAAAILAGGGGGGSGSETVLFGVEPFVATLRGSINAPRIATKLGSPKNRMTPSTPNAGTT
jgi:hypothetical protein